LIYLDSSVALAQLFDEARMPPSSLWAERLVSSRLLVYEVWTRLNAAEAGDDRRSAAEALIERIGLIEMLPAHLERALQPFSVAVRTLDALHLATMDSLRRERRDIALASFDRRLLAAARALGIAIHPL
jgi:predicted nucleic acid-binding protein